MVNKYICLNEYLSRQENFIVKINKILQYMNKQKQEKL